MLATLRRVEFGRGRSRAVTIVVTLGQDKDERYMIGPVYRAEPDALAGPEHLEAIQFLEGLISTVGRKWTPDPECSAASEAQIELRAEDTARVRKVGHRMGPHAVAVHVRKP